MKIVVLVKQVPDTWGDRVLDPVSGRLDREASERITDEISERALEMALAQKDRDRDTHVVVLSMGPADVTPALRRALSMGADAAVHVLDDRLGGADMILTSRALATTLERIGYDLVIAGNWSTDGNGGMVPAMIAEYLAVPHASNLEQLDLAGVEARGHRATDDGSMDVRLALPAVISVTERTPEARFPKIKGIMAAKRKPITVLDLAALGLEAAASVSRVISVAQVPPRQGGRLIVDDGNAGAEIARYLADANLAPRKGSR